MGREGNFGNTQRGYVGLNSHLFFLQPSALVFRLLTDMATSGSFVPFKSSDQDVLETVFASHKLMPELPLNLHTKTSSCAPHRGKQSARPCVPAPGDALITWSERLTHGTTANDDAVALHPLTRLPRSKWAVGFCCETAELGLGQSSGGSCADGSRGSFALPEHVRSSWHTAHAFCNAHCLRCPRCAVVSVSLQWADCSWFSQCDLAQLRNDPAGFRTTRVRTAPAAKTSVTSVDAARRIAVCMAGHPRTFARRHVYSSIGKHLLGALRAHHNATVDLFALLKSGDATPKQQSGWDFAEVPEVVDETWAAVAALRPRLVLRLRRNHLLRHKRCGDMDTTKSDRSISQPAMFATCLDVIERAEALDGERYDWIVRTRPDAWWYSDHPPLCATINDPRCSLMLHRLPCSGGTYGYIDQHFALPRAAAPVLRALADQYLSCGANGTSTTWNFNSNEHWLSANFDQAVQALDLPPPQRPSFPFVLVRKSAREPSAKTFCCMHHGRGQKWHDECMAAAYPGEVLPQLPAPNARSVTS